MKGRVLPHKDRKGIVELEWHGEGLGSCRKCNEYKGWTLMHDFESEPGHVIEGVWCAFCGTEAWSNDITSEYAESDFYDDVERRIDDEKNKGEKENE